MCGIAGHAGAVDIAPGSLERMCDAIRHRGPDDSGTYVEPGAVGLGFRRLSIIDLAGGHQPVASEDGRVVVTCNGEIYNYGALRRRLLGDGHRFSTLSDTEVIAHLYEERGPAMLEQLNGMFAIALWDQAAGTLMLARDRMGVKPLYWAPVPGGLVYASEPSAILASGLVTPRADPEAIAESLVLQYVHPPRTGFAGIHKLAPGERLLLRDGRIDIERWWRLGHAPRPGVLEPAGLLDELDALMRQATHDRLVADVPLGAFLSGGVDSSLVVAYMAAARGTVKTFSIDFAESAFSEGEHARAVSQLYGTEHHEFIVEPRMVPTIAEAVRHVGEPYADSSAIPTYLLSRETVSHVTVALSGDGGDEALGGYTRYDLATRVDRLGGAAPPLGRALQRLITPRVAAHWPKARRAADALALAPEHRYASVMSHFTPADLRALLEPSFAAAAGDLARPWRLLEPSALDSPNRYLALDVETYLPGDLLTKVDRMSMTHGLEVRSPMLDYRLHEWAAGLPGHFKIKGGRAKWMLKDLAARRGLPPELVDRRKQGFGVPIGDWFRADLRPWLEDVLLDPGTTARGITRPREVRRLLAEHVEGRTDHAPRLWNLMTLELWHREYIDR